MASRVEGNAPTCCICSSILFGKCFVLDCDHILCDRCTNEGSSYGCTKHNRQAKIMSLAFCHQESKMIIRMAESVEFALNGQCDCEGCSKNALAAVNHCNHKLCRDCLLRKFGDGNRRKKDCITCPVIQCKNQFPLVFADGILGGCQMHREQRRNQEKVIFYETDRCKIPRDSGRSCNNKGCFYSLICGYDVCCGCMMTYVTNNHRPEYVNKSLTDVVPCWNQKCKHILHVKQILQLLDETEQKLKRKETVLCFANDKTYSCKTIGCKNTVTIFFKCGHYYCSCCVLRTTVNYIPLDGEFIPCRMCLYVTCSVWIRESNLNSISIGVDDFLRESSRPCYSSQHGRAVVETRCCSANLCLNCLTDVMQKSCVLSSFFGIEYDDVIMCNGRCICGVPKRFFFQFGMERSYPLFVEKQSNEQTDSCKRRAEKLKSNKNNLKMSKITPTENVEKMDTSETQSSNASNINTKKYNDKMAREKKSNGGRSTDGSESNKSNAPQSSNEIKTEKVAKMETDETQSINDLNEEKGNNNDEATSSADLPTIQSAFKGINSLMPVTNAVTCIRCKSEAIAQLKCKHSYCCACLDNIPDCIVKTCYRTVPKKDVHDLLNRLNDDKIAKEKKSNGGRSAVGSESNKSYTPQKSNETKTGSVEKMDTDDTTAINDLNEEKGNNNDEATSSADLLTIQSAFKGIDSLMPVTNAATCIRCKSEAIAALKCKHSYCWVCLDHMTYMTFCNANRCYGTVPNKDVHDLLTRLNDNAFKESGIAVGNENETNNTPQQSTSEVQRKPTDQTSVVDMKGVRNLGMTCYANCIFQILGQTNKFKDRLANSLVEAIEKKENPPLTDNLTALLEQLSGQGSGEIVEIEVSNFLRKMVALESSFERYLQNDCCEFLMSVLEGLKSENEATTLMFENTIQTFCRCRSCFRVELGRPQMSHSLLIPLSKGGSSCNSVSAGLKGLLKTEKLGKDVLPCQSCNIKGDTIEQGLVLTKLPDILIMQIGRVTSKKSFWRYAKKKDDLVKYEEEMEVPQTVEVNGKAHERIFNFSLFGVVLHSGSIDSGHYYSFVKKLHTDRWFSCNDSSVRQIEKKYIFENPNAYLLFYEKKGMIRNDHRTDVCCQM